MLGIQMADQTELLRIRRLDPAELAWANERYAEVDFLPSPATDLIALALIDGCPAGLGRVTRFTGTSGELGGMYVFSRFRGLGIAKCMIDYLVGECHLETLFCLPFEHLHDLYAAAGFSLQPPDETVPHEAREKHAWCNSHYPEAVLLMSRGRRATGCRKICGGERLGEAAPKMKIARKARPSLPAEAPAADQHSHASINLKTYTLGPLFAKRH